MRVKTLPFDKLEKGARVLLRLDLNIPGKGSRIRNDFKLKASLPTIISLRRKAKLIIVTHRGNPSVQSGVKKSDPHYSTQPLVGWLRRQLGGRVMFCGKSWPEINRRARELEIGDILVLENIRLFPGETENNLILARRLAALGDICINDAFAVCHRKHASVAAIKRFIPTYAGPLLEREVKNLEQARNGKKPLVIVLGGAKVSTKLPLIKSLLPRASAILTGGALANTFLLFRGYGIGKSQYDNSVRGLSRIASSSKVIIPRDAVVSSASGIAVRQIEEIRPNDIIIDIGPKTEKVYLRQLSLTKTVIWNGPVGVFEKSAGQSGSKAIASALARLTAKGAFTLAGGGETAEVLERLKVNRKLSWVSTGGGASLAYLGKEPMPGLTGIVKR